MKGFILTIDALLSVLVALSLLALFPTLKAPNYNEIYSYKLLNDIADFSQRNLDGETIEFIHGNGGGLAQKYEEIAKNFNFCLKVRYKDDVIEANCNGKENKNKFVTERDFWDGESAYRVRYILLTNS